MGFPNFYKYNINPKTAMDEVRKLESLVRELKPILNRATQGETNLSPVEVQIKEIIKKIYEIKGIIF